MILERLEVGPFASNCYIVASEKTKEGMLVDAGADASAILKNIKALGVNIKLIVLTHAHIDHIGAVKQLIEATGAKLAVHADEKMPGQDQKQMPSSIA